MILLFQTPQKLSSRNLGIGEHSQSISSAAAVQLLVQNSAGFGASLCSPTPFLCMQNPSPHVASPCVGTAETAPHAQLLAWSLFEQQAPAQPAQGQGAKSPSPNFRAFHTRAEHNVGNQAPAQNEPSSTAEALKIPQHLFPDTMGLWLLGWLAAESQLLPPPAGSTAGAASAPVAWCPLFAVKRRRCQPWEKHSGIAWLGENSSTHSCSLGFAGTCALPRTVFLPPRKNLFSPLQKST